MPSQSLAERLQQPQETILHSQGSYPTAYRIRCSTARSMASTASPAYSAAEHHRALALASPCHRMDSQPGCSTERSMDSGIGHRDAAPGIPHEAPGIGSRL